ncbi:MAG: hypothetical protein ACE5FD_01435 [Anaerolineae bacterium]
MSSSSAARRIRWRARSSRGRADGHDPQALGAKLAQQALAEGAREVLAGVK